MIKLFWQLCFLLLLSSACNNKDNDDSPYAEILGRPPFAALTDSIHHDNKNEGLYFRRAVLLNSNNFPEPALQDFKKAWSLKKDERYAFGIGTLLMDKKPDSAILFLEHAIQQLPNSFLLRLNLARAYDRQGNSTAAMKLCYEILSENPQQVDVMKLAADIIDRKGEKNKAIQLLERAYQLTPFDVELNYVLALKYAETKNPRLISLCDSLIRADSQDVHAEPYYYKGIYYSNINDKQKALSLFNDAVQKDYYFLDGYIEKAAVLYDLKRFPEAVKTLNLALTISPKFADAWYWLGKCQEALGEKDGARLNYQKALGLDPSLKEAGEGIKRLGN